MNTASGVRVGIAVPQGFPDGRVDLDLVRRVAAAAEDAGFDDLWVMEQITGRLAVLEPVTLLAYLAGITSRVRLGAAVLVTTLRNPVQLAKALSSLDHLAQGRLTVGVGLGTTTRMYPAFGLPEDRRVARFVEGLRIMQALWTEAAVTLRTEHYALADVAMEPKPVQQPLPLWFGARAPEAQRRAARFGTGWMGAGSSSVDEFLQEIASMKRVLADEGKDPAGFTLSKRVYLALGRDREDALSRMRPWIGAFYGNPQLADRWAVAGTPADCLEALRPVVAAGVHHLLLNPVFDPLGHLRAIAEEIAPKL